MFRAKTVLIVGAGASVEVGLPMGSDLLQQIIALTHITFNHGQQTKGDPNILQALKTIIDEGHSVTKINEHLRAAWQLSESAKQALSIDNVIDALEDPMIELVGKLGIVRAILEAESASLMFKRIENQPDTIDLSKFENTWYSYFTKILTENVRKSNIDGVFNNLEIINFNYDRCLEQYLPHSLASYYGIKLEDARETMKSLVVHRPYGLVGRLPWQIGVGPSVPFGDGNAQQLAAVVEQVRTFTERVEEGKALAAMKNAIASADRIIFLGFAFHRQNVQLVAQQVQRHTEVVATAFGISKSDRSVIEVELTKAFEFSGMLNEGRIDLTNMKCVQFFQDYWRTLTAEKSDREPVEMPSLHRNYAL